jgi:putative ABC transport system permease protein
MIRHAWRAITNMPALAAVIAGSLAVGIGLNTVVFSWIQHRLLQPLPGVSRSASLMLVESRNETGGYPGLSWAEYGDLRRQLRSFQDLFAARMSPMYVGDSGQVERTYGMRVSDNYFSALDLKPTVGRFFKIDDNESVAVLSYGLWQRRYDARPDAVGKTIRVNGRELTIIGVAPRRFQGTVLGLNFDVWVPATMAPVFDPGSRELTDRSFRGFTVTGRLRSGLSQADAQTELDGIMAQFAREYPQTNASIRGEILQFWQSPRGPQRMMAAALLALQGFMLLMLLAVCGNTANLILARASARQREMGVRLALGAGPARIVGLLLTESVLLALIGAVLALPVAYWGTQAFRTFPLTGLPIRFETSLDVFGLIFAILLGVGCGLIVGVAPAAQLARIDPLIALRSGARTAGRSRLRNTLMGIQVALALVVLIVAGVAFSSFLETRDADPGFRRQGVMLGAFDLAGRNMTAQEIRSFQTRLVDGLADLPGAEAVAIASSVPLDIHGLPSRVFTVEGYARTEAGFDQSLANTVTPGYFAVMDIPIRAGTDFAPLSDSTAPPQVIVNEEFVRRYLSEVEPLGRKLQARNRTYIITGVVRNSLYNAFGEPPTPIIYFSYRDNVIAQGEIHVRTRRDAETAIVPEIRRVVRQLDPELPVFNVRTLTEHVESNLIFRRVPARMFAVLGPMLLALAAIGIYAVVAYTVSLRTTEIGVRLAIGATAARIIRQVVIENLGIIGVGAIAGWLLAFIVAIDVLPGGAISLPIFLGVPLILLSVAAVACWLPVRRATRIVPMAALRQE